MRTRAPTANKAANTPRHNGTSKKKVQQTQFRIGLLR